MPILKRIIRFLAKTAILKRQYICLKRLARQTDNTIDDQFEGFLEARLFPKK